MYGKITFVSAGAGSGKTHRLTEILHDQLVSGAVRPSGVIATTFTRKAAAELRERVRAHLLKRGAFGLANAMGQARIGTVHAVCGELLQRFAFEAGLATEQRVLEEDQAAVLLRRAVDSVMDETEIADFLEVVNRLGLDKNWQQALRDLVDQVRANDIAPNPMASFARQNADDLLAHFPQASTGDLSADLRKAIAADLPAITRTAEEGKKNTANYLALVRDLGQALNEGTAPWSDWIKLSKARPQVSLNEEADRINRIAARVAEHPGLHRDLRTYLERMFSLCAEALERYGGMKRELGLLDFADQEHRFLKVLDHADLASVLQDELDLLLVDEFQDTSPIQLALFLKLAQFAKAVYWVGDIKQAIYGFRGSDTALMTAILGALRAHGGKVEVLPYSWRSRPSLVQLVNAVFTPAFKDQLPPVEIGLQPKRSDQDDGLDGPVLLNWMLKGNNLGEHAAALATAVGALVKAGDVVFDKEAKTRRAVRYGDIAILCRTGEHVDLVAAKLKEQGIPSATAKAGLLATPEATLALACLRRLNDRTDTIATAEILSLADSEEPESWVADRLHHLAAGGRKDEWLEHDSDRRPAHPLVARLAGMRQRLYLLSPVEALRMVITECDLPAIVLRWRPEAEIARQRLANLDALLRLAAQYEEACRNEQRAASVTRLILWLDELAQQGLDGLAEPDSDAVRVLTHHAAKGLEWPVVVLTDLGSNLLDRLWSISARSQGPLDIGEPLKDRFIRYWPWPFGAQRRVELADAIANSDLGREFHQAAVEEGKRLLYVSITRARDILILARNARSPSGEWLDSLNAPWLLGQEGKEAISLPNGEQLATRRTNCAGAQPPGGGGLATAVHWFPPAKPLARVPLMVSPSASDSTTAHILETVTVGERIPLAGNPDMDKVGNAIHASLALACADLSHAVSEQEVERILTGQGVATQIQARDLTRQVHALLAWITQRWGQVDVHGEYPVQCLLETGQILQGRMDLLLRTGQGLVIIDHKSSPQGPSHWQGLADEHAGQLDAYARAIQAASGEAVTERWLFLPVAAGAIRVGTQPGAA